jgi:predicted RNase H-like nuclease (RuvC/YqgF family)
MTKEEAIERLHNLILKICVVDSPTVRQKLSDIIYEITTDDKLDEAICIFESWGDGNDTVISVREGLGVLRSLKSKEKEEPYEPFKKLDFQDRMAYEASVRKINALVERIPREIAALKKRIAEQDKNIDTLYQDLALSPDFAPLTKTLRTFAERIATLEERVEASEKQITILHSAIQGLYRIEKPKKKKGKK